MPYNPTVLTDTDRRTGLGYLTRGQASQPFLLIKPALTKLDKMAVRFLRLDLFCRTPFAPFMLEMTNVSARCDCAGLMAGFRINPTFIDFFIRLRHGYPAPEQHHLALKAGEIIREMVVLGIVCDNAADQPLEFLGRRL